MDEKQLNSFTIRQNSPKICGVHADQYLVCIVPLVIHMNSENFGEF
jgi:hypothetical protein